VPVIGSISLLPVEATHISLIDNSEQIGFQLTSLPEQISLTLGWRSVSECGCDRADVSFAYKGSQFLDYEQQRANRLPIKLRTYLKFIDVPLTRIVTMGLFPCRFNNHIVITDSQWIICTNTQLHAKALWHINFWSTDTEVLWAMDNLAQWHFSAFSWQCTASRATT